jgi:hypothetical protein
VFLWNAFHELDTDRQIGFAEGPIPFTAIDSFARRYGIVDVDEFDGFVTIMRGMDAALQETRATKRKQAEAEADPPTPRKALPKPLAKKD